MALVECPQQVGWLGDGALLTAIDYNDTHCIL